MKETSTGFKGLAQHEPYCPRFHKTMEIVGRRWTGAIIRAMVSGHQRFNDISSAVPGLSDRLLSERLKELEAEGIVDRIVIPDTPVKVEYHLTVKGQGLEPVLMKAAEWAQKWLPPHDDPCRS
ncbi:MAG: winged helix-turn-helix transcriptional regulator [Actinomycetota bacterium]|nr:helix-turn-helix transcriptional regulator [Actinomycetota bacterium]